MDDERYELSVIVTCSAAVAHDALERLFNYVTYIAPGAFTDAACAVQRWREDGHSAAPGATPSEGKAI